MRLDGNAFWPFVLLTLAIILGVEIPCEAKLNWESASQSASLLMAFCHIQLTIAEKNWCHTICSKRVLFHNMSNCAPLITFATIPDVSPLTVAVGQKKKKKRKARMLLSQHYSRGLQKSFLATFVDRQRFSYLFFMCAKVFMCACPSFTFHPFSCFSRWLL